MIKDVSRVLCSVCCLTLFSLFITTTFCTELAVAEECEASECDGLCNDDPDTVCDSPNEPGYDENCDPVLGVCHRTPTLPEIIESIADNLESINESCEEILDEGIPSILDAMDKTTDCLCQLTELLGGDCNDIDN